MFKNILSILYKVAFVMLCFGLAKSCISDYVMGADETKVSHYEQMINDDSFVYAELAEQYTQTTVAKTVTNYTFDYTFNLNDKNYSGKITIGELPNIPVLKLYYLKSDPNIVSHNPSKDLETEKKKGQSINDLIFGIFWAILTLLILVALFSEIKKLKQMWREF